MLSRPNAEKKAQTRHWSLALTVAFATALLTAAPSARAAIFDCGSDGSDGALVFPADTEGIVLFDPASFAPPLDPDHDGVYHFTTVTIPTSMTLRFSPEKTGWRAIYWLAQGDIVIDGALDLSGQDGYDSSSIYAGRPSTPGPGGYPGAWASSAQQGTTARPSGFGPGDNRKGGSHGGNSFLYPLMGGSGGGGYCRYQSGQYSENYMVEAQSGAGGGALLLASNTAVEIDGAVLCEGGDGGVSPADHGNGNGGGGGAIRLLAPVVAGTGVLRSDGGKGFEDEGYYYNDGVSGEAGWIRIEADSVTLSGDNCYGRLRVVSLIPSVTRILPAPGDLPSVNVTRIGGIDLPASPSGSFETPDVILDTQDPVLFEIEARNIPLATTFTLLLWNETETSIEFPSGPLIGAIEASSTTATHTISSGFTRGFIFGSWEN